MLQWTASQAENGCKIQDSYDDETGNNMLQLKLVKPKTREDCRIGQVLNGEGNSTECINKETKVLLVFLEP